ncbi:glycoside hydrolase [Exidia glandulosa HHB12029]|uniref:mannan endo-1,4-beta-mannosidase n=1 Tax=Exidia glandulosa HHB12029 TaxID=1314781 RepID=A0A165K9Z2_EXIGL|nr:glycoside hydrolase [Exidia glandulosa HHB12029]
MFPRLAAVSALLVASANALGISLPGFVTTKGSQFSLNGKPFFFAGTNAYWLSFLTNLSDTSLAMDKAKAAGHSVIRIWGFNDKNATFDPNGLPQYSPDSDAIFFQSWDNGKPTISAGLQHLDQVISLAERKGLKLTVALTNNWADYGGMDVYTANLGGSFHDDFYTAPKIKNAFKNYVRTLVSRHVLSPAIFAWELGNEPRCGADGTRNLPRSPSGCDTAVMTAWAKEISAFVKSIDPFHMVVVGSEGFFSVPGGSDDWAYSGADGVDSEALLRLKTIDAGTFHLYPDWWSKDPLTWAPDFIAAHGTLQRKVGKPVIMEEYGWMTPEARLSSLGIVSNVTRLQALGLWQDTSIAQRLAGDQYWQLGVDGLSFGLSTNDGFTIYMQNKTEAGPLIFDHVKKVQALNH